MFLADCLQQKAELQFSQTTKTELNMKTEIGHEERAGSEKVAM
jgi:hypothetical protein